MSLSFSHWMNYNESLVTKIYLGSEQYFLNESPQVRLVLAIYSIYQVARWSMRCTH